MGRKVIDSWAEPDITARLRRAFAHYEDSDIALALIETMRLFRDLAMEVSRAYGFAYPSHADNYATGWVLQELAHRLY